MTQTRQRSAADWQRILRTRNIRPTRSMGQNFLTDPGIVARIADAAGVRAGDLVVEIGPGMGILTRELLSRDAEVIGVELDRDLAAFLREDIVEGDRFQVVERDARYVEIPEITGGRDYEVVANLPYSVATVIIRHFMESTSPPRQMTVMVQKEVAERMTAQPGSMSLLGLATHLYAEAEIAFIVPPDVFLPPPKVDSAVVVLQRRAELPGTPESRDRMFDLATMAFQRKRKTISNGLSMGLGRAKPELDATLASLGLDASRRPQTLSVEEWLAIAQALPA
jgi:16S rRNA (adenine1518-N6/adenine1519-N6)-dimethyltransferase